MNNEAFPDDMTKLWQSQPSASQIPPLEEIRKKAGKFRSQIGWRNFREYLAAALMVPFFGYSAWTSPSPLMQAGNGLMIAGLLYMAYQLHRQAGTSATPAELGWSNCLAYHRTQLERQRDALRGVWKWYLGPMVPGLAVIMAAGCVAGFRRSATVGVLSLLFPALVALLFWWIGRLNRKAAGSIQEQIDALNDAATAD